MKKFTAFAIILILLVIAGAVGMRLQGIIASDLLGSENIRVASNFWEEMKTSFTSPAIPETNPESSKEVTTPLAEIEIETPTPETEPLTCSAETCDQECASCANPDGEEPTFVETPFDSAQAKLDITAALATESYEGAVLLAEQLSENDPSDVDFFSPVIRAAIVYLQDPEAALRIAQNLVTANPDNARAYNFVGWAALQAGDLEQAKTALNQALALDRTRADVHLNLGDLALAENDPETAKLHYTRVIEIEGADGGLAKIATAQLSALE